MGASTSRSGRSRSGPLGGLWRQRLRWAEGGLRRILEHGPAVLASPHLRPAAKLDFAAYAGQVAVPPVILGALAGAVLRGRPGPAVALVGHVSRDRRRPGLGSLRWEIGNPTGSPLAPMERGRRALRVGLFDAIWLVAIPGADVAPGDAPRARSGTRRWPTSEVGAGRGRTEADRGRLHRRDDQHGQRPGGGRRRPDPRRGGDPGPDARSRGDRRGRGRSTAAASRPATGRSPSCSTSPRRSALGPPIRPWTASSSSRAPTRSRSRPSRSTCSSTPPSRWS